MIPVKNVSRGPLYVDGAGVLESEATGPAADTDHTAALIDAGSLITMPAERVLADMTVDDLKAAAEAHGIDVPANARKQDLIDAIEAKE